jgi:hypothetical protein
MQKFKEPGQIRPDAMDDNVLAAARPAINLLTNRGGAELPWSTRSNSGKTGNGCLTWG